MERSFESIGVARESCRTATGVILRTRTDELEVTVLTEDLIRVTMRKQSQAGGAVVSGGKILSLSLIHI